MTGLDTNILVRCFALDDPIQSPAATRIMEKGLSAANPGYISVVAMVETVWVLDRAYGFGLGEIADAIERILQTDTLVVENEQEVFAAMAALGDGRGASADALIGALVAKAGCSQTVTFDRKAARLPGFVLA